MGNITAIKMLDDLSCVKDTKNCKDEIDIGFIIKKMSVYSRSDLYLFRDCIDLLILYNNY